MLSLINRVVNLVKSNKAESRPEFQPDSVFLNNWSSTYIFSDMDYFKAGLFALRPNYDLFTTEEYTDSPKYSILHDFLDKRSPYQFSGYLGVATNNECKIRPEVMSYNCEVKPKLLQDNTQDFYYLGFARTVKFNNDGVLELAHLENTDITEYNFNSDPITAYELEYIFKHNKLNRYRNTVTCDILANKYVHIQSYLKIMIYTVEIINPDRPSSAYFTLENK